MVKEYEVDEATFKNMSPTSQLWMLYNTFNSHREHCDSRMCKLEKKKRVDTALAGGTGLVGGAIAYLTSKVGGGP